MDIIWFLLKLGLFIGLLYLGVLTFRWYQRRPSQKPATSTSKTGYKQIWEIISPHFLKFAILTGIIILIYIAYLSFSSTVADGTSNVSSILTVLILWYVAIPVGFFAVLLPAGLILAKPLSNVPYVMKGDIAIEGRHGFTTALGPGQAKILERSGRFVKCIMNYPGHTFKGYTDPEISERSPEYWKVIQTLDSKGKPKTIKTADGEEKELKDAHPVPFPILNYKNLWSVLWFMIIISYRYLWWVCKWLVYRYTGYVFTGFPYWQNVRVYRIEYHVEKTTPSGDFETMRKSNFSDFYNLADFDVFVPIASSDTKDFTPVKFMFGLVARVFNPWLAAYKTGSGGWTTRVYSVLPSKVNDYARGQPLDQVLVGKNVDLTERVIPSLGKIINGINDKETDPEPVFWSFGLEIESCWTPDRDLVDLRKLDPSRRKLADKPFAQIDKQSRIIRAEGDAVAINKQHVAIKQGGEYGRLAADIDGRVRLAEAAPDKSSTILSIQAGNNDGSNDRPGDKRELREIKSLLAQLVNETRKKEGPEEEEKEE